MGVVRGIISKVIYFKNNFGIVQITLDHNDPEMKEIIEEQYTLTLTVTSNFDRKPFKDELYEFTGQFKDTDYGYQFQANHFERIVANTLEGIVNYLSSDLFTGIGKQKATRIYHTLGQDCINVILNDPKSLDEVKGLTTTNKEEIVKVLQENAHSRKTTVAFLNLGLTMTAALKIINTYGNDAYEIVKANPYMLIDEVEGYGFKRADQIALSLGFKESSPLRLKALIMYLLKELTYSFGNTYFKKEDLYERINKELRTWEIAFKEFNSFLEDLSKEKKIIIEDEDIFLKKVYDSEKSFAFKIKTLAEGETINIDTKSLIEKAEKKFGLSYGKEQKEAISNALLNKVSIITGGPGTGKSTIIKGIIYCFQDYYKASDLSIAQLAPTGRAAKRMQEITGKEAMTIHKFLGYEGGDIFRYGEDALIDSELVIVDEFSMVDIELANRLVSALTPKTRLVIVGDADQLPSIGPGDVLNDLIKSDYFKVTHLHDIYRQEEGSAIVNLAHSINEGYLPEYFRENSSDWSFIALEKDQIINGIIEVLERAVNKGMDLIKDIQVLVPMYRGENGIHNINNALQEKFNPLVDEEIKRFNHSFRVGDKVLQLVNRSEKDIMNGDIGKVYRFTKSENEITGLEVEFDSGIVKYKLEELDDLMLAYAITIHKAQGSEFDLVVMPITSQYYIMLRKKLIYTGITRAKKFLVMLGSVNYLAMGITKMDDQRQTKLKERLEDKREITPFDFM